MKNLKTKNQFVSGIGKVKFYGLFHNGQLESYVCNKKGVNVPRENLISGNWKEIDIDKAPSNARFMVLNAD